MPVTDAPGIRAPRDVLDRLGVPMPAAEVDPAEVIETIGRRITALVRLLLFPAVVVAGLSAPDVHPVFWALCGLQLAWKVTTTAPALARVPRRVGVPGVYAVDLLGLSALLLASGGADSPLRAVVVVIPFTAGFLVSPRMTAAVGGACLGAFLLAAAPDLLAGSDEACMDTLGLMISILAGAAAGLGVSRMWTRATERVKRIDADRRRLLATGMDAEDRERRRVSYQLHGDVLQRLLAAAQDLEEGELRGAREGVREGVAAVRDTVRDLHPATLRHAGLEPALRAALEHRARNVIAARVDGPVDRSREPLLLALVREIGDVLAGLGLDDGIAAQVFSERGRAVLALSTTCGCDRLSALAEGLRGCAERVAADGGSLTTALVQDGRALVTARLGPDERESLPETRRTDDLQWRSELLFSAARLAAPPSGVLVAFLSGDPTVAFFVFLGLAAAYDAGTLAMLLRLRSWRAPTSWLMGIATLCSAAAVAQQGDPATPLVASALSLPFLLTMTFSPRGVALVGSLAGAVLAVGFADTVADGSATARSAGLVLAAAYAWAVVSSVVMATGRERMARRRAGLEQGRRRLLHDGLRAADAERQRISEALHDGALQELMIAGQDLDEALDGQSGALDSGHTALRAGLAQLRDAVTDLHPPALEHGGLRPALASVVERVCRRAGVTSVIEVDPRASGRHDELMINLVRELATNVCKHARAGRLEIDVRCTGRRLQLTVHDDGVGTTPDRIVAAVAEGHIGLAAARERVEADGGTLQVESSPGGGTTVTALLPAGPVVASAPVAG